MELVDGIEFLARTYKLDRFVHYRTDREGRTTAGITVELGQHHAVKVEAFVELFGCVDRILSGHRVYHEQNFVGLDGFFDGSDLIHHLFVDCQTSGRIDNYQIVSLGTCFFDGILGDGNRIFAVDLRVHRYVNLFGQYAKLLDSCRTVNVTCNEQRAFVLLGFQHAGQLTRESGLTRTLQTGHQDDCRLTFGVDFDSFSTHQLGQFVMNNLHHQLARFYGCEHVLSQCLFLHRISESFGYFIVNVGIEQCLAHVFQGLCYVDLGDFAFTFQNLKRPFESFA